MLNMSTEKIIERAKELRDLLELPPNDRLVNNLRYILIKSIIDVSNIHNFFLTTPEYIRIIFLVYSLMIKVNYIYIHRGGFKIHLNRTNRDIYGINGYYQSKSILYFRYSDKINSEEGAIATKISL